jgi:hypothetical protein
MENPSGTSPYQVPKSDLNQPGTFEPPPRASVGDVLLLVLLQLAAVSIIGLALPAIFGRSWSGYPFAGRMIGAMAFAMLEKQYRPRSRSIGFIAVLALWSTLAWLLFTSISMGVFGGVPTRWQAPDIRWLETASRLLVGGSSTFVATLVGLWLGSRGIARRL